MALTPNFPRTIYLLAPMPSQQFQTRGASYSSDGAGVISVAAGVSSLNDILDLYAMGCVPFAPAHIGCLIGANMNVTTDQAIPLAIPAGARFRITKITAKNASVNLTTAAGGVYPAASKGGTPIVLAAQAYSALSAAGLALDLTIDTVPAATVYSQATVPSLFFSLTTGQGAPATADLFVYGDIYWTEG